MTQSWRLSEAVPLAFAAFPRFEPERFAIVRSRNLAKYKQFHQGLKQLEEEGAIQVLVAAEGARRDYVLAAAGELQFDVVAARLAAEYGVEASIERLPYVAARAVLGPPDAAAVRLAARARLLRGAQHRGRVPSPRRHRLTRVRHRLPAPGAASAELGLADTLPAVGESG